MLQEPTEALAALDLAGGKRQHGRLVIRLADIGQRNVADSLVRALLVIMSEERRHQVMQVALAADDEVSGAGESHPRALSEPYMSVSTHRHVRKLCPQGNGPGERRHPRSERRVDVPKSGRRRADRNVVLGSPIARRRVRVLVTETVTMRCHWVVAVGNQIRPRRGNSA